MTIKRDIETRLDIELFLRAFYEKVKTDETIGIVFTKIVAINWEHHIPVITDFWETILLDNPVYNKNAMEVHYKLNRIFPLQKKHFNAWLTIFNKTLDEMFDGEKVILAKKRALAIALLMENNMNNSKNNATLL